MISIIAWLGVYAASLRRYISPAIAESVGRKAPQIGTVAESFSPAARRPISLDFMERFYFRHRS